MGIAEKKADGIEVEEKMNYKKISLFFIVKMFFVHTIHFFFFYAYFI